MAERQTDRRERILDVGEALIRQHGFNGVSFRDIAEQVGIKSASVHYHFPTKADFALAVTERYADRFLKHAREALSGNDGPGERLARYAALYRQAFLDDGKMCLCGMLAAEAAALPEPVRKRVATFFDENLAALEEALGSAEDARLSLMALQGALLMARAEKSSVHIDRMVDAIVARAAKK